MTVEQEMQRLDDMSRDAALTDAQIQAARDAWHKLNDNLIIEDWRAIEAQGAQLDALTQQDGDPVATLHAGCSHAGGTTSYLVPKFTIRDRTSSAEFILRLDRDVVVREPQKVCGKVQLHAGEPSRVEHSLTGHRPRGRDLRVDLRVFQQFAPE